MTTAEERRESRIPKAPPPPKVLSDRSNHVERHAGKRRATGATLDAIPETARKWTRSVTIDSSNPDSTSKRPTRSAATTPVPASSAAVAGPSFRSEGAVGSKASGSEATGDESFEQLSARTGVSVEDVLQRKMQVRKGMRPEKKVEEVAGMVKELRAVGWHLHAANERIAMEAAQWKATTEQLEAQAVEVEAQHAKAVSQLEAAVAAVQAQVDAAERMCQAQAAELQQAETVLVGRDAELGVLRLKLQTLQEELDRERAMRSERDAKVHELDGVVRDAHKYQATLQDYNGRLQADVAAGMAKHTEAVAARDELSGQLARLGGELQSTQRQQQIDRDQMVQLREERDSALRDAAVLRADADNVRAERARALADAAKIKEDLDRIRAIDGKSFEMLETLNNDKATLEVQLSTQHKLIYSMREELAAAKERSAMAEGLASSRGTSVDDLKADLQQHQEALAAAERKIYENDLIRRKLHNIIQELKGNIRVFCRVRPVSSSETANAEHNSDEAVDFPDNGGDVLGSGTIGLVEAGRGSAAPSRHAFTFDRVFTPGTSQEAVFVEISELVQSALDGQKVCIFAYGQTGSGKTYTMMGSRDSPGMIPRAMEQVFESSRLLGAQGWTFTMQASMLEIYNEEIKDLLCKRKGGNGGKEHKVMHDLTAGSTCVTDLTTLDVTQPERVQALLAEAMDKRTVGCTALNEQSSRSHMVFTLKIEGHNAAKDARVSGVLNLIDLAGSERVKDSGATGQRMKEAQSINKSLSALGDVIAALANKDSHIPFRNSKLTYLLQTCLGGDAKTLMFVNVAPQREFAGESLCSLRFAAKVNSCEINPRGKGGGGGGAAAK